jgi:hypothetical protein
MDLFHGQLLATLVSSEVLTSEAQFGWMEFDGHDELDVQRRADAGAVE